MEQGGVKKGQRNSERILEWHTSDEIPYTVLLHFNLPV